MSIYLDMLRKLTDVFNKKESSNFGKLFLILSKQIDDLNDTLYKVEEWRDLDKAEGTTLDMFGGNIGQNRGKITDELMRVLIKARIARNSSDGTINSIIDALALSLNTEPSTIKIKSLWSEGEPAALMIEGLPIDALNRTGLTAAQFGYIAQQITAAGVRIASIDLSGTYALSSQANVLENSVEFGLAPLDQSTGGTLGTTFDPDESITLPI